MLTRTQVQDYNESLERERRLKCKGSARIRLENLDFSQAGDAVLDASNVKRLVAIFQGEGCFQQESQYHLPAIIDREQLDLALRTSDTSSDLLLSPVQAQRPELRFPSGFQLRCLHGRHRVQAAREMVPRQTWWTVELYLSSMTEFLFH